MSVKTIVLGLMVFLLVLASSPATSQGTPVVVDDEKIGYIDWRDLKSFSVWDNGTHILLKLEWWGPRPEYSGTLDEGAPVDMWGEIGLDLDNNRYTGMYAGSLSESLAGADLYIWVEIYGSSRYIYVETYKGQDQRVTYAEPSSWLDVSEDSLTIAIPLDWIRTNIDWIDVSSGTTIAVLQDTANTFYITAGDPFSVYTANFTVPYSEITVDGDDSDWEGISPIIVDVDPNFTGISGPCNLTSAYVASDNQLLYLAFRLAGPFDQRIQGYTEWWYSISVWLDLDNDGEFLGWDGFITIMTHSDIYPEILVSASRDTLQCGNISGLENGFVELPCTVFDEGVPVPDMAGRNISMRVNYVWLDTVDNIGDSGYTRIFYTIGSGGYVVNSPGYTGQSLTTGTHNISVDGLEATITTSGSTDAYLVAYQEEPTGNATLPGSLVATSNYYMIWFSSPGAVTWPVHLEINVQGLGEPVLYYYNKTSGEYTPVADQYYDPDTGILSANYTYQEYLAGDDPVIVVLSPPAPPTVGGQIETQKPEATATLLAILLAIIILVATIVRKLRG